MICIFVVRHVFFYLILDMYHAILGSFAPLQPTRMLCSSEFQNLRTAGDGLLDLQAPSAFGYPQDAQMTYKNRIALMRCLLKSDSEEENEGDDHIDGEQESPKISFKAEAAEAMDAAESPEDMIPLPKAKMELDQPDRRDVD